MFSRSTKLKEIRASNPNNLLLDGGDQFQGTFWFYVYKGMAAAQFMKKLGYDAMVSLSQFIFIFIYGCIIRKVTMYVLRLCQQAV